jgi:hypothetical protein
MKADTNRFARVVDSITDGRTSLGFSVENDTGGFDAFDGADRLIGSFTTRAEARAAIVRAADSGSVT